MYTLYIYCTSKGGEKICHRRNVTSSSSSWLAVKVQHPQIWGWALVPLKPHWRSCSLQSDVSSARSQFIIPDLSDSPDLSSPVASLAPRVPPCRLGGGVTNYSPTHPLRHLHILIPNQSAIYSHILHTIIQKQEMCMRKFFLKGFSRLELIPVLATSRPFTPLCFRTSCQPNPSFPTSPPSVGQLLST